MDGFGGGDGKRWEDTCTSLFIPVSHISMHIKRLYQTPILSLHPNYHAMSFFGEPSNISLVNS